MTLVFTVDGGIYGLAELAGSKSGRLRLRQRGRGGVETMATTSGMVPSLVAAMKPLEAGDMFICLLVLWAVDAFRIGMIHRARYVIDSIDSIDVSPSK